MFELIFLGTNATKPTLERFTSSFAIRYEGEVLLFDAGEGIQIRLAQAKLSPNKISRIFITHFHGDHVLGIPGLLYSMAKNERTKELYIHGPKGTAELVKNLLRLSYGRIPFKIYAVEGGYETKEFEVRPFEVNHGTVAWGWVFKQKDRVNVNKQKMREFGLKPSRKFALLKQGKEIEINGILLKPEEWLVIKPGVKVVYSGDTAPCESLVEAARGADLLIHEATYLHEDKPEDEWSLHSSAREAAEVARKAGVKYLFLTHFSPRYQSEDLELLWEEAFKIFPHVFIARDLMKLKLKPNLMGVSMLGT